MQPRTRLFAFLHWLNLLALVGVAYATVHTGDTRVLGAGALLEVLWLVAGARMEFFQRYVALKNGKAEHKIRAFKLLETMQQMSYEYKQRYRELEKTKQQVLDAVKTNKRLELGAIQPELDKIDGLLDSFVRIAIAHKKQTKYLEQNKEDAVRKEIADVKARVAADTSGDPSIKENLGHQVQFAEKRLEEHLKVQQSEKALAVQLETIEKTMTYLKSKIMSFEKPEQLSNELSSVVMGLEAAERTLQETDKIEEEIKRMEQRAIAR
ncbi:MAG: hypothetical protein IT381_02515 [Deltaproteobacteria bacterium]|nr:hypothetical protein [Deltaproteobacteria bacterium]